ncbi:MAG: methionine--tRNA ligase [Myxococcales bacterium]|nr:methionine--tRNA ligase [Myxococcota bacterium]MDW8283376.1 methionine--tRNA ligase [Myxococcales bacterium]
MSEASPYFLTTPIYYVTAEPHLGHAYTTIVGDALCRYERIRRGPERVFYLTGTDEHGEKIERAALEQGITPQAFADRVAAQYRAAWQVLHIRYDDFIRTTEPRHEAVVQRLWRTMQERGDIYKAHYEGLYCVACESFYLEKDLLEGGLCPDHKRPLETVREEGYFFRLSRYEQPLLQHYAAHPDFVEPPMRLNEVRAFVERGLRDLSISRSSFRWGIPVPGDPGHVIYVWIDALTNYWSAMQEPPARRAFWGEPDRPVAIHLVGKEITRFHAVYWPAMLMSAGLPLPRKIVAHGWWTVDGEKMSKTLGNVVDPVALSADIGADALRYFVLREVPLGADGDFSYEALLSRYNSELCNDLGNLLNRTLVMVERYSEGVAQRGPAGWQPPFDPGPLIAAATTARRQVEEAMAALQPSRALEALFQLVREGNTFVERVAYPLTRTDPQAARYALYLVLEVLRWLGLMLEPFLPERAVEIRRQLGLAQPEQSAWPVAFGELPEGTAVRRGATLFPRIDADRRQALLHKWRAGRRAAAQSEAGSSAAPPSSAGDLPPLRTELVSLEDFQRLDVRTARILSAERIPNKDRLLRIELDVGLCRRTVVAGLAAAFSPEELVGRTVLFLANLKPAKIGGVLSEGMILAVGREHIAALTTTDRQVPPGTPVR